MGQTPQVTDMNYIVIITGLGSSIFCWWRNWAKWYERECRILFPDARIIVVSSDGRLERRAEERIQNARKLVMIGHSNGFRDGLLIMKRNPFLRCNYFAGIDMALGAHGVYVPSNVEVIDEFHAKLAYVNTYAEANNIHTVFEVTRREGLQMGGTSPRSANKGHTAAASDRHVRSRIISMIKGVLK